MTDRNASGADTRSSSEASSLPTGALFGAGADDASAPRGDSPAADDAPSGFGAGIDKPTRADEEREATGTLERSPRRRTRRRRSRSEDEGGEAAAAEEPRAEDEGAETARPARRKRRRRSRSGSADAETEAPAGEARPADSDDGEGEAGEGSAPRRKRRRRRRKSETTDETGEAPAAQEPAEAASDEDAAPRRRRRRGSRGGRGGRRKKAATDAGGPVGLEVIPGEDDELAPIPAAGDLPELPDDAEMLAGGPEKPARKSRRKRSKKSDAERPARKSEKKTAAKKRTRRTKKESEGAVTEAAPASPNVILVNAGDREETRVAVVENGLITDFSMTAKRHQTLVNDIYRGRVVNLETAIGAAFIDFGQGRNGFLHTSDVLSVYGDDDWSLSKLLTTKVDLEDWDETSQPHVSVEVVNGDADDDADADEASEDEAEEKPARGRKVAKKRSSKAQRRSSRHRARPRLPITDLLKKGQSVVVQVTKDAIGDKGPTLTTYISIPGRYLVLMPSMARTGVSRKIEDEKERKRLKKILEALNIPAGMGVIVRTAGVGCTKADIKRDLDYLLLLWDSFGKRLELGRGPAPLYEESDVAIRTIRDLFDENTEAVVVDDEDVHKRVRDFTEKLMPENVDRVQLHDGARPLFHHYSVEQDFERIFARRVDLPSGGSIVFDQTEALVAIDVNSGKTRSSGFDFEDVALKTNLDAVPEIARQIRLRDLGGIIVCDFIDMLKVSNRRLVERALRTALSGDRARSKLGRISQFGLLELTRQRLGPGLSKMLFHNCQLCRGTGKLRTVESKSGAILRRLGSSLTLKGFTKVEVRVQPDTAEYLRRNYSNTLRELEQKHERELRLVEVPEQVEDCVLRYLRADGREVRPGGRRKR